MVLLIPGNANPTRDDIDAYIIQSEPPLNEINRTVREIECKSSAGALLHPAEEYFLERAATL